MQHAIGIDVSKNRLDAYRLSDGRRLRVTNDRAGHKALFGRIGRGEPPLAVFEAAGPRHRQLEAALGASRAPFVEADPRRALRCAEASGRLAETDRVEAAMLARMGAVLELAGQAAANET